MVYMLEFSHLTGFKALTVCTLFLGYRAVILAFFCSFTETLRRAVFRQLTQYVI